MPRRSHRSVTLDLSSHAERRRKEKRELHWAQQRPAIIRRKFKKQIVRKMEPLAEEWRGFGPGQPATTEEK